MIHSCVTPVSRMVGIDSATHLATAMRTCQIDLPNHITVVLNLVLHLQVGDLLLYHLNLLVTSIVSDYPPETTSFIFHSVGLSH